MDSIRTIRLHWAGGTLRDMAMLAGSFSRFAPQPWQPAINAYRCRKSFRICVDLAGVDQADIELTIERRRLILRGEREVPEPKDEAGCVVQTLAMEIDYGPFLRIIQLPDEVDAARAVAEQENGLLWITLPVKE
jgi:HSP20 family protein